MQDFSIPNVALDKRVYVSAHKVLIQLLRLICPKSHNVASDTAEQCLVQ